MKFDKKIPVDIGRIEIAWGAAAAPTAPKAPAGTAPPLVKSPAVAPASKDGAPADGAPDAGAAKGGTSKTIILNLTPYYPDLTKRPTQSDTFRIDLNLGDVKAAGISSYADLKLQLPLAGKVYLQSHRPQAPVANDVLNRIEFSLQQIQFNQIRLGP